MKKWIMIPALLIAGGASAIASALVVIESHETHGAPEFVRNSGMLSFAVYATGPFGLVYVMGRSFYYAKR